MFDALYQQRAEIEEAFGESLEWERLDARRACRIAVYRPGSIDDPPQTLEKIRDWGIDRLLRFKAVIGPRASELIAADVQLGFTESTGSRKDICAVPQDRRGSYAVGESRRQR